MKIFLLGAGGFIGSHLTEKILNESGHEVVAFDLNGESLAPRGIFSRTLSGSKIRLPNVTWSCPSRG